MNDFNPTDVGLAIITYYPKWYRGKLRSIKHTDKVRGDLALEFFTKATKLGYKVVPKFVAKRYTLDFALIGKKKIDIEIDGIQHEIIGGMP